MVRKSRKLSERTSMSSAKDSNVLEKSRLGPSWINSFEVDALRTPRWLCGRHLQTSYAFLCRRSEPISYTRQVLESADGDFIDIDLTTQQPGAPLIIACHGLEGSSRSKYMLRLMSRGLREGFNGIAVNHRTCGRPLGQTIRTYHYGFIDDLDQVVRVAAAREPTRPIVVVGYSLGGSIVANWLGRCSSTMPSNVCGAATVSAPLIASRDSHCLDIGLRFYGRFFLRNMKRKAKLLIDQNKVVGQDGLDIEAISKARTMEDFEKCYTAPAHGFSDLESYYRGVSPAPWINSISVPTLMLHASDDPVILSDKLPMQELGAMPTICLSMTKRGGHVGFVSRDQKQWLENQLFRWFRKCLANVSTKRNGQGEVASVNKRCES